MGLSTAFCIMRRIAAFYVHIKPGRKAYTSGKRSASGKVSASGKRSAYGNGSASGKRSASGKGSAYGEKSTADRVKTAAVGRKTATAVSAAAASDRQPVSLTKQRFVSIIKRQMAVRIRRRSAALRTTRNKKAILLIALMIPLIFLVFLLFSHLNP